MSTLEYLDGDGTVAFGFVPAKTLHAWLSILNGSPHYTGLPDGVNRGKVLEELEERRQGREHWAVGRATKVIGRDRGYGLDWREFENNEGLTHLEELLVYQPKEWRAQVREYFYRYGCDLNKKSSADAEHLRTVKVEDQKIIMKTPIEVVLFHPEMKRTARYEPLNFLLAYDAVNPLPALRQNMDQDAREAFKKSLSPLGYFIKFKDYVPSSGVDELKRVGQQGMFPRVCLIKEFDFSNIVGQRLAKNMIRRAVVNFVYNRDPQGGFASSNCQPLSMIFAGPSGNGKTEMAKWLAELLNKPEDDNYVKVDCGKLTCAKEIFGMSGSYQGSGEGSALNNFIVRLSRSPKSIGIVLLDEIEKATRDVLHGLFQVIDKGEWTNKRLERGKQTDIVPCHNVIFIMTTNACDDEIQKYAEDHAKQVYLTKSVGDFVDVGRKLENLLRKSLAQIGFGDAFMGRVDKVVPFLPMARGRSGSDDLLLSEMMVVAKVLIEREQEKFAKANNIDIEQEIDHRMKHQIANIVVENAIPAAGVRSIQKLVSSEMSEKLLDSYVLTKGEVKDGSTATYHVKEGTVDFRVRSKRNVSRGSVADKDGMADLWK